MFLLQIFPLVVAGVLFSIIICCLARSLTGAEWPSTFTLFSSGSLLIAAAAIVAPRAYNSEDARLDFIANRNLACLAARWVSPYLAKSIEADRFDDDYGNVIGRGGRTAQALRTVVKAASVREQRRVLVDIVD